MGLGSGLGLGLGFGLGFGLVGVRVTDGAPVKRRRDLQLRHAPAGYPPAVAAVAPTDDVQRRAHASGGLRARAVLWRDHGPGRAHEVGGREGEGRRDGVLVRVMVRGRVRVRIRVRVRDWVLGEG